MIRLRQSSGESCAVGGKTIIETIFQGRDGGGLRHPTLLLLQFCFLEIGLETELQSQVAECQRSDHHHRRFQSVRLRRPSHSAVVFFRPASGGLIDNLFCISIHTTSQIIRNFMVGLSAAVIRRQQFLIRCLGYYNISSRNIYNSTSIKMQSLLSGGSPSLEVDAVSILKSITPSLDPSKHKGQAGKIAVVGGCREYTGAPYFSAISALKIGADLSHVFCTKDAAPIIKSYSPELIVHPILEESYNVRDEDKKLVSAKVIEEVDKWMERFDCLVIGPGLGRDPFLLDCVSNIMKHARESNVPLVIDGDGLFLVTNSLDLITGYPLAILTPNVNEYKRLIQKVLQCEVNDQDGTQQLLSLAKGIGGVTILRKGESDFISNGETVCAVSSFGSPRRCGGQGDVLSGSVAVFISWARRCGVTSMSPAVKGCIAGSVLVRKAAAEAFVCNRRSTLTTDIIENLGSSMDVLCPVSR